MLFRSVSDRWLPVSPNGRLDGFEWKVPLAEIGVSRPVIEVTPPPAEPITIAPPGPPDAAPEPPAEATPEPPAEALRKSTRSKTPVHKSVEPVIPLVHAPDDPGLESGLDADPVPETSTPPASDAWQRFRQLFR